LAYKPPFHFQAYPGLSLGRLQSFYHFPRPGVGLDLGDLPRVGLDLGQLPGVGLDLGELP